MKFVSSIRTNYRLLAYGEFGFVKIQFTVCCKLLLFVGFTDGCNNEEVSFKESPQVVRGKAS